MAAGALDLRSRQGHAQTLSLQFSFPDPKIVMSVRLKSTSGQLRLLYALLTMLCAVSGPGPVLGQDSTPNGTDQEAADSNQVAPSEQPGLYWHDEAGNRILVDELDLEDQAALREFLERRQLQQQIPAFDLPDLNIRTRLADNVFFVDIELTATVRFESEWVRVPVLFPELQVTQFSHESGNDLAKAHFETGDVGQKSWLLFGAGDHTIKMQMVGQVRNNSGGQNRIRFTAPNAPISHLVMDFGERIQNASVTDGGDRANQAGESRLTPRLTTPDDGLSSQLEVWGVTGQTDISWQPAPAEGEDRLLVRASSPAKMTLDLTTVPASLLCRQPLEISGGQVNQLRVSLPNQFQVISVTARNSDDEPIPGTFTPTGEDNHNLGVIQLNETVSGMVTLVYSLSQTATTFPQTLSVQLPDLEVAENESADVDILIPLGLLVEPDAETRTQAPRVRVETQTDSKTSATAYRLLSSESRIDLRVSETKAFFAVEPQFLLKTQRNNLLLTARFPVNVIHGSLNELTIDWKDFEADGWQILGDTSELVTDDARTPVPVNVADERPDELHLVFPDRQSRQFVVEFEAFRDLESFLQGDDAFFLPDISASTSHSTTVSMAESDTYSMAITQQDGVTGFPLAPLGRAADDDADEWESDSAWLVEDSGSVVRLRLTAQTPEVAVDIVTELTPGNGRLNVHQELQFEVSHRDLNEVRLLIPEGVNRPVVHLGESEQPMDPATAYSQEMVLPLPPGTRGEFIVNVDYAWSPADSALGQRVTDLPLVMPVFPVSSLTVGTLLPEAMHVHDGDGWRPVYSDQFAAAWQIGSDQPTVPIIFDEPLRRPVSFSPEILLARSVVGNRSVVTEMSALFSQNQSSVLFTVPAKSEVLSASVNGVAASVLEVDSSSENNESRLWRVRGQDVSATTNRSVTIVTIRTRESYRQAHHLYSRVLPDLPTISGLSQTSPLIWRVSTDDSRTLFPRKSTFAWQSEQNESQLAFFARSETEVQQSVSAMLSPYGTQLRGIVIQELDNAGTSASFVFAGDSDSRVREIIQVSWSLVLLASAAAGFAVYMLIMRLHWMSLVSFMVAGGFSLAAADLILPDIFGIVLARVAPGIAIAVLAGMIQKSLSIRGRVPAAGQSLADSSTVFAMERSDWRQSGSEPAARLSSVASASGASQVKTF